jgi:hypothetical protein
MKIARRVLAMEPLTHAERVAIAASLGISLRSLRRWLKEARDGEPAPRRPGRPRFSRAARRFVRDCVRACLDAAGWAIGEDGVLRMLGHGFSRRLVREALARLKHMHRASRRSRRARRAKHVAVEASDAIWSVDATHLGRGPDGEAVLGEVVREVASTRTLAVSVGPAPSSREVVMLLDAAVEQRGRAPLVISTDGGGENRGALGRWCARHRIVHLVNAPHVPEHNAWVEHGNAEIKAESGLGKGVKLPCSAAAAALLRRALHKIDRARPRRSRGGLTAVEADAALPAAEHVVERRRFYAAACSEMNRAVRGSASTTERRCSARVALLQVMECFGLLTTTRGREVCPWPTRP